MILAVGCGVTSLAIGQVTERVSVATGGAEGDSNSLNASISADVRYVAFASEASNLVAGDTNNLRDVFVHDRKSGTTERVSVDSGGAQGDHWSDSPSISADGRYVAFRGRASNLVAGDTNSEADIFVHDRQSGATERVSLATGGTQGNGYSYAPSITADGRYVAFRSAATNLVAGDTNARDDIFVHDRGSGTTERVSVATGGAQGNWDSEDPSISADGRYVAFVSKATNLVAGDTNGTLDIFVRDRQSGTTERASVDSSGAQGNDWSYYPSISADGRCVAFASWATNLVAGDTNADMDIFVHDRGGKTTERVSVDSSGTQADDRSFVASISADGRYVAFDSYASNLVARDTNDYPDVFVHDRRIGTTDRVSVATGGAQGNSNSFFPSISPDGRWVAFESSAQNLVAGDTQWASDVFVRDCTGIGTQYCTANANSTGFPAHLFTTGSASATLGDLILVSTPVPDEVGIFFHGMNPSQTPFGDGFLCTTGDLTRGSVVLGAGNSSSYAYANSDAKHSVQAFVGSTRHFQHWFSDPMGGGALFNTSNAVAILILP